MSIELKQDTTKQKMKASAFLFKKNVRGISKITVSEKYLLISMMHPISNTKDWTIEEVDKELESFDFLTCNWREFPKPVFIEIFNRFADERIIFFCAHFQIHLENLSLTKQEMVQRLADTMYIYVRISNYVPKLLFNDLILKVTTAEKYLLFSFLCPHSHIWNTSIEDVDETLKSMNVFDFSWKYLPKTIFFEIFSKFSNKTINYCCAHFHVHMENIDDKPQMISDLWDFFNK